MITGGWPKVVGLVLLCLGGTGASAERGWAGVWGFAPGAVQASAPQVLVAGTFRYRIRLTQGGARLRLTLAVPDKALPLVVRSASVAFPREETGFATGVLSRPLKFNGRTEARLAPGSQLSIDHVNVRVRAGTDVIVTLTTAAPVTDVPVNAGVTGDFAAVGAPPAPVRRRPFVARVDVFNPSAPCTIVTLGDSITEGTGGSQADWRGWPGRLANRLIAAAPARHCGVVNMGIGGNRLLREGRGMAAIDRFERDVAAVPGATHVVILEGINDLTRGAQPGQPPVSAADLIAGYRRLIAAAHRHGLTAIGGTILPAGGSRAGTPPLDAIRNETNRWIRDSGAFDAVIDFDTAVRAPENPTAMQAEFDSGDHLHPGDAGYTAMGDAIPLRLFGVARVGRALRRH